MAIRFGAEAGPLGWLDLLMPWAQGVLLWPAVAACLVLWSFYMSGVQRAVFRVGELGEDYRERAAAIGMYAGAPLVALGVAMVFIVGGAALAAVIGDGERAQFQVIMVTTAVAAVLVWGAMLVMLLRAGQWAAAMRRRGIGAGLLGAAELAGLWLLGVFVFLGLLPWCAGFVWIVFDGWR
jgi:hypothetical protein